MNHNLFCASAISKNFGCNCGIVGAYYASLESRITCELVQKHLETCEGHQREKPKQGWSCGLCEQEKMGIEPDKLLPLHSIRCPNREYPETLEELDKKIDEILEDIAVAGKILKEKESQP